jgi:hypothetical protein
MSQASERTQMLAKFWWETYNESDCFEDLGVEECIVLQNVLGLTNDLL